MPTPSPVDRSIDSVCKNYKDDQCKEAFKTLQTFAQSVTDPMVVDEKVGESLVDVAYKIGASFEDLGAIFTQITDRSVAAATDVRNAAADWFRFPLDIQQHIDSTAHYAMQLTTMVEMLIFAFKILVVVMIVRVIFEIVYETLDVVVFGVRRTRRIILIGTVNRSASIPIIWKIMTNKRSTNDAKIKIV